MEENIDVLFIFHLSVIKGAELAQNEDGVGGSRRRNEVVWQ